MFTGLITATASLISLEKKENCRLTLHPPSSIAERLRIGDSLAVDGVCLTLTESSPSHRLSFYLSRETLRLSRFSDLIPGSALNLELPLTLNDFLGGHLVTGHVDGTVRLRAQKKGTGKNRFFFTYSNSGWKKFLVPKGSVALNGVSLTLVEVHSAWFSVEIIPHTLNNTNLHLLKVGERVHIELDFLAKTIYNIH